MKYRGVIDLSKNTIQFRNVKVPLEKMPGKSLDLTNGCSRELQVALVETLTIPPFSEIQAVTTTSSIDETGTWLVEGSRFDILILAASKRPGDPIARWAGTHTYHQPPTNRGSHPLGNKCGQS